MDTRRMRRICASLVRDLDIPVPAEPDRLIAGLCEWMSNRVGQPVHHRLVPFPPGSVSGVWVATDTAHYVLCERETSEWHRIAITAHEFWHMEADHDPTVTDATVAMRLVLPSLDPQTVARVLATRTRYDDVAEQEAELFASLLLARVSRWLPRRRWAVPAEASDVVARLEAALGRQREGDDDE